MRKYEELINLLNGIRLAESRQKKARSELAHANCDFTTAKIELQRWFREYAFEKVDIVNIWGLLDEEAAG